MWAQDTETRQQPCDKFPVPGAKARTTLSTRDLMWRRSFLHNHCVVQPVMRQPRAAINARVQQGRVFIPAKRKNGLIYLLGVEDPEANEQVKVIFL